MPAAAQRRQELLVAAAGTARATSACARREIACELLARPAAVGAAPRQAGSSSCCLRPATRISKNSSRLLPTMQRKRSRSSSGTRVVLRLREHAAVERELRQLAVDRRGGGRFHGSARRRRRRRPNVADRRVMLGNYDTGATAPARDPRGRAPRGDRGIFLLRSDSTFPLDHAWVCRGPHHPRRRRPRIEQLPARNRPRRRRPDLPARHVARDAADGCRPRRQGAVEARRDGRRARVSRALPRAAVRPAPLGGARRGDQHLSRRASMRANSWRAPSGRSACRSTSSAGTRKRGSRSSASRHELPRSHEPRLVIDIGGGSTEFIIGRGLQPERLESLKIGCVGMTQRFFAGGAIAPGALDAAETVARVEIEAIAREFRRSHWHEAYASSGTAVALADILVQNGFSAGGITPAGLARLRRHLVAAGHVSRLKLNALKGERAPVLAGGFAIMAAAVAQLDVERIDPVGGAVRLGVLYDLLGRTFDEDARAVTVERFIDRYGIDRGAGIARGRARRHAVPAGRCARPIRQTSSWSGGRRSCTKPGCRCRTPGFTSTAPTSCRTRTCRASPPGSKAGWRCSSTAAAADSKDRGVPRRRAHPCGGHRVASRRAVPPRADEDRRAANRRSPVARRIRIGISKRWLAAHPLTDYMLTRERAQWEALGYPWQVGVR